MKIKLSANKKKIIVLTCMVLLLVVAGTLNFVLNANLAGTDMAGKDNGGVTTTFFSAMRTSRESKRNEQISILDSIIASESSTAAAIASAEEQKLAMAKLIETEMVFESQIKSSGYSDVVVTIGTNSVSVVLDKIELDKSDLETVFGIIINNESTNFTASMITAWPHIAE